MSKATLQSTACLRLWLHLYHRSSVCPCPCAFQPSQLRPSWNVDTTQIAWLTCQATYMFDYTDFTYLGDSSGTLPIDLWLLQSRKSATMGTDIGTESCVDRLAALAGPAVSASELLRCSEVGWWSAEQQVPPGKDMSVSSEKSIRLSKAVSQGSKPAMLSSSIGSSSPVPAAGRLACCCCRQTEDTAAGWAGSATHSTGSSALLLRSGILHDACCSCWAVGCKPHSCLS